MATREELISGLQAAHAAGNEDDARVFADALSAMPSDVAPPTIAPPDDRQRWPERPNPRLPGDSAQLTHDAGLVARGAYPVAAGALAGGALGLMGGPAAPITVPAGAMIGAASLPIADAGATGYNMLAPKFGAQPIRMPSEAVGDLMTRAGLPVPQTTKDRILEGAGSLVGAMGTPVALPRAAATAAPAVAKTIPTIADIRTAATAAYKTAEDAGVVVKPDAFNAFVADLGTSMDKAGLDKGLHAAATRSVARLGEEAESGEPLTLEKLETLRRVAKSGVQLAQKNGTDDEIRLANNVVKKIDNFVENLDADSLAAGDPKVAVPALKDARALWRKNARMSDIQDIVQVAEDTGKPQYIQQQFQKYLKAGQKDGGWNDDEWDLVKKIGQQKKISLDSIGKLSPGTSPMDWMKNIAYGTAAATVSPLALVIPAVGGAAKVAAPILRQRNIGKLSDIIATDNNLPAAMSRIPQNVPGQSAIPAIPYMSTPMDQERARRALVRGTQ